MGYRLSGNLPFVHGLHRTTGLRFFETIATKMHLFFFQFQGSGICCNSHRELRLPQVNNLTYNEQLLHQQEMRRISNSAGSRIVNGKLSALGEFPFMVSTWDIIELNVF